MIGKLAVLTAVSVGLAVYVGLPWRWFSYHPLLMLLAHLALASVRLRPATRGDRMAPDEPGPVHYSQPS